MSKYGNRPTTTDDGRFDSAWEYEYWQELKLRERAGDISELQRQVRVSLEGKNGPIRYQATNRQAFAVVDFRYIHEGEVVWEDTKGYHDRLSKLKYAVLAAQGIDVRIVRKCKAKQSRRRKPRKRDSKQLAKLAASRAG